MKRKLTLGILSAGMSLFAIYSCSKKNEKALLEDIPPVLTVEVIAGSSVSGDTDGSGSAAAFTNIKQLALCPCSGALYAYDNGKVKKINDEGLVQTISGTIPDANPFFNEEGGITAARDGNLYVAGWKNIYKISNGKTSLYASLVSTASPFTNLGDLTSDNESNLYSVENTGVVRKLGTQAQSSTFFSSQKLWESVVFGQNGTFYALDIQSRIYKISSGGELNLLYPTADQTTEKPLNLTDIAVAADGTVYASNNTEIHKIAPGGGVTVYLLQNEQEKPFSGNEIALGNNDKLLYITDGLKVGKIRVR